MFKITEVFIDGFWQTYDATVHFGTDVNIIIGKNGTGKTTFMNILIAVLNVDPTALEENEFQQVTIKLKNGRQSKTIRVKKISKDNFYHISYSISRSSYDFPLIFGEEIRYGSLTRRKALDVIQTVQRHLREVVKVASLSVYRFRSGLEYESKERRRLQSPIDLHLESLMVRLTEYQLELSQAARNISIGLQKEVLTSLLYRASDSLTPFFSIDFDEERQRQDLISVYKNLGIFDNEVNKRINEHLGLVKEAVRLSSEPEPDWHSVDFRALDAAERVFNVFNMSLKAEQKTKDLFGHANKFVELLRDFIAEKHFKLDPSGRLLITHSTKKPSDPNYTIPVEKLSSGEKQLIILFVEALLQRQRPFVFLADEPELSLHIEWQRRILPAIRELNPNAQIIVATHSPEVAGKFKKNIINMRGVLHGRA